MLTKEQNSLLSHRYPSMVQDYYVGRLRGIASERKAVLDAISTREAALARVEKVRAAVADSFGKFPDRAPLNAVVTGSVETDSFLIQKVVYESRSGLLVTGNFYLPARRMDKHPGVLGLCGHADVGKAYECYQLFCQGLASKGFAVFIIDPVEQGERTQFTRKESKKKPPLCHAHNLMGNQMALVDDFFGSWRVWDAIRGLDYLLSRPEVDPSRIGVTGNSGGGTLTTYVSALDPRPTMVAPGCYICSYLANVENELPSDAEQNPPGILASGLEQVDLLMCHAPRPTLIIGQKQDFFDPRRALESAAELKKIYALLEAEDNAGVFIGPDGHGYSRPAREAMYGWFMRHAGIDGPAEEDRTLRPVDAAKLNATELGTTDGMSKKVFDFTAARARELRTARPSMRPEEIAAEARRLLNLPERNAAPHHRVLRNVRTDLAPGLVRHCEFAIETEPGIQAFAATYGKDFGFLLPKGDVHVHVGDTSAERDILGIPFLKKLAVDRTAALVGFDPRGMGQSEPKTCGTVDFLDPYGADYLYASTGEMLGESYLGRRVHDLLSLMDLLRAEGADKLSLSGSGLGSVVAAFGALLHPSAPETRLLTYLPSYLLIAEKPFHKWPLSSMVRGVLKSFDLPDVYRALGERLTLETQLDELMR